MEKPKTEGGILDQIWNMIAGYNDDGMYFQLSDIIKEVREFIANNNNSRGESCPHKLLLDKFKDHLEEHEKGKDFRLKKWQVLVATCAFLAMVAFNIYSILKP